MNTVTHQRAPNILIINTNCSWNKGSAAQVISTVETLRTIIPDAIFTLYSDYNPELDSKICRTHNIKVLGSTNPKQSNHKFISALIKRSTDTFRCMIWAGFHRTGLNAKGLLGKPVLQEFYKSDLIIDLSGDSLSDLCNFSVLPLLNDYLGIFLRKKVVVYSQSIGPFNRLTKPLARFYLNRANLIVIREKQTLTQLNLIKCANKNIRLFPDVAFNLTSSSGDSASQLLTQEGYINKDSKPLVGLGTSALLCSTYGAKSYLETMAKLADYIVEKFGVHLLLVPHVIILDALDDRAVAMEIYRLAKHKEAITVIKGDYPPGDIWGMIGKCDLFIGTRMHTAIGATSLCIPTVSIGWSHKYFGIMASLGLKKYCCEFKNTSYEELFSMVNDAWIHRDQIRHLLSDKIPKVKKAVVNSCLLIKDLVEQPLAE